MKTIKKFLAVGVLATLAGCASASAQVHAEDLHGVWGEEGDMGFPHLVLQEDGSLAGSDGCNRLIGQWELNGDTVEFTPVGTTMMYCEGVDTSLNELHSATLTDGVLSILDQDGRVLTTLPKTA